MTRTQLRRRDTSREHANPRPARRACCSPAPKASTPPRPPPDLLIAHDRWLRRDDFLAACVDYDHHTGDGHPVAWVDWDAVPAFVDGGAVRIQRGPHPAPRRRAGRRRHRPPARRPARQPRRHQRRPRPRRPRPRPDPGRRAMSWQTQCYRWQQTYGHTGATPGPAGSSDAAAASSSASVPHASSGAAAVSPDALLAGAHVVAGATLAGGACWALSGTDRLTASSDAGGRRALVEIRPSRRRLRRPPGVHRAAPDRGSPASVPTTATATPSTAEPHALAATRAVLIERGVALNPLSPSPLARGVGDDRRDHDGRRRVLARLRPARATRRWRLHRVRRDGRRGRACPPAPPARRRRPRSACSPSRDATAGRPPHRHRRPPRPRGRCRPCAVAATPKAERMLRRQDGRSPPCAGPPRRCAARREPVGRRADDVPPSSPPAAGRCRAPSPSPTPLPPIARSLAVAPPAAGPRRPRRPGPWRAPRRPGRPPAAAPHGLGVRRLWG